uniref:K Homology domain-containing protein n=1 Tax=Plectus sambesii TaxID=2011161 RepID=A0A914VUB4_9BILA
MSATPERSLTEIAPASGQKRSFGDRGSGPASKKAHIATAESADDSVQVKVLVPTSAAGAIIGKGGESMRTLKSDSGCKVQMSKNQDIYPGTNERICLVKGKISAVMKVIEAMMDKIREKVDHKCPPDAFDHNGVERNKEVRYHFLLLQLLTNSCPLPIVVSVRSAVGDCTLTVFILSLQKIEKLNSHGSAVAERLVFKAS